MKYGVRARWLSRFASGPSGRADEAVPADGLTAGDVTALPTDEPKHAAEEALAMEDVCVVQEVSEAVPETASEAEPAMEAESPPEGGDDREVAPSAEESDEPLWREADGVRRLYAGFDLAVEREDPRFARMLEAGVPMVDAYRALHMDEVLADWADQVRKEAEKRITNHVQARGSRPPENGTAGTQGIQLWQNVHQLTRQKRAEIASRAQNGEHISFR